MRNQTIISKGKYAHHQPPQLISLKQYIFAREQGAKKQLLLRFVNERNEKCTAFSFVLYQLDAKGSVIKEERFETEKPHAANETFVFDRKIYVEERCTDFRIRLLQATFGDYTYRVENAGILVSYDKAKELHEEAGSEKKRQMPRAVRWRTVKKPWLCVAVALLVLAAVFSVGAFLLYDFIDNRNTFSLSGVKYEFVPNAEEPAGVIITGYSGISGSFLLPSEIEGYTVLGIQEEAFISNRRVRRVRVEGLDIPLGAFQNCTNLPSELSFLYC